jgi:aminopeptidase N
MTALLLAILLASSADSLMGPGVSAGLARMRAERVRDVRYDLALDVTARDTARGRVAVRFTLARADDVILDFRGPRVSVATVNGAPASGVETNGAHVRVPARLLKAGGNAITLDFAALIAPAGASIIRYHDPTDGSDYLYTLLVPADANQLFPCFDQPDIKARVSLRLTTPSEWSAVANGRLLEKRTGPSTVHVFSESEPISTYLIAFAAGPWATRTATASSRPITLYARRSRIAEAEVDSIILANDRAATWLEGYFASKFPFQKLDVVLAPAFPFGGMEHPGAIFYNENSFIYREPPTLSQRLGRTSTIYHEVAHQWFGDLVTMRWFDDLWLKEGFATYMAAKMQAALDPKSEAWKTFYLRNKPNAYSVDATSGTTPVWQQLANLDQAKSNYGAIVYNKAPSVLKQLDYLVGEQAFQTGLRRYLEKHAYANATWRDLLDAIGAAAGRSLSDWGSQYILRPGMPVLEQQVVVRDGVLERLTITQRPARELSGRGSWPIRVEVLLGHASKPAERITVAITGDSLRVPLAAGTAAPDFVFANASDYGYALVLLDERSIAWLEKNIGTVSDTFLRSMLWGALWDQVREARLEPTRYIALALREVPKERDELLVGSVLGRLARATRAYLGEGRRAQSIAEIERVLRAGADDAGKPYGIRKPFLDTWIGVTSTPAGLAAVDSLLDASTAAGAPLRAPTRWSIVMRLLERGAPTAERRLAAETRSDTTSDGRRRAFIAAVARPDAELKRDYFRRYFADAALNEEWATGSLGAFNAVDAQVMTRPYIRPALDSLPWIQKNRRIFYLGSWLSAFLDGQTDRDALRIVEQFLTDRRDLPRDLREKVLQAADELERTVRIREAYAAM